MSTEHTIIKCIIRILYIRNSSVLIYNTYYHNNQMVLYSVNIRLILATCFSLVVLKILMFIKKE